MRKARGHWSVRLAGLGAAAAAAAVLAAAASIPVAAQGDILDAGGPDAIEGSYIVAFKDSVVDAQPGDQDVDKLTSRLAARHAAAVNHKYKAALRGFAAAMSAAAAKRLAADPAVAFVAQDHVVRALDTQSNPPSWGLDRIDQRDLPLSGSYAYPAIAGAGVTAYIIDTGIRTTHGDFGGRAAWGTNTTGDGNNADCNGHGTHVAGSVGGSSHGVAKRVSLVAVKVLNCSGSGSTSSVVAGIDCVTANHAGGPAVANMSLGGSPDSTLDAAVRRSIADGITYAIASGNSNANACNFSPARVAEAITVNASDRNDNRASFSNFGTCTNIFAPGVSITSAWNSSNTASNTISGTSMATPHVSGAAALYLGGNSGASPAAVAGALIGGATTGKIVDPGSGSPNRLLFAGTAASGAPSVNHPGNQTGTVGVAASLQLSAGGGTPPYTWSATGLPPDLSISTSGLISGTPTTRGTYNVTATARDSASPSQVSSASFVWTVNAAGGCSSPGQKLGNPGFESGSAPWTATSGVIGAWSGIGAPHGGTRSAWLDGYGTAHTDTLSQSVAISAGCTNATLKFWLRIDSAETTSTVSYDRLTVQVDSTALAAYSNLNESGYTLRTFNVGSFAGRTVTVKFTGSEDASLQTSFVIDDTALNAH